MRVAAVGPIRLVVSDLERSTHFFEQVLGFDWVCETLLAGPPTDRLERLPGVHQRVVSLRLGDEVLELAEFLSPRGRPVPAGSRSNDRWFQHVAIVVSDIERAYALLREHHVRQISNQPQRLPDWNQAAAGIRAFYFLDPDGHPLELIQFPPGKGEPRWQRGGGRLFLGIDHTAIAVSETGASLAFYRDRLGLKVVGGSENRGPEQEQLSGVPGARVRITSLRARAGPGIELLEYLAPSTGRPRPPETCANDLIAWRTGLWLGGTPVEARHQWVFADPDGHRLELLSPRPGFVLERAAEQPAVPPGGGHTPRTPDVVVTGVDGQIHRSKSERAEPHARRGRCLLIRGEPCLSPSLNPSDTTRWCSAAAMGARPDRQRSRTLTQGGRCAMPTVDYWHVWVDESGVSHQTRRKLTAFERRSISSGAAPQWIDSLVTSAATVVMTVLPSGWLGEWHENPRPQWIVPLSGRWFVETMDGLRVEMGPGEASFGNDQHSRPDAHGHQGHRSGTVGHEPCTLLLVQLEAECALDPRQPFA